MNKYTDKLGTILQKREDELQELGLQIRNEVIVPICKKHKFTFLVGNGYAFQNLKYPTKYYQRPNDIRSKTLKEELIPVFDLLDTPVYNNKTISCYVGQYRND